jgi:pimeloyl-ACP methyl ester carboxylesterase
MLKIFKRIKTIAMPSDHPIEFDLPLTSGRIQACRRGSLKNTRLVFFIPGLSSNKHCFDYFLPELAHQDRLLVAVDLRGRGKSALTPAGTYGLASHTRDILEMATLLGAQQFDLVGWSMGALIGIHVAQLAPHRLRRLVMIDHAGKMDDSAIEVVTTGLDRLDMVVSDPQAYIDATRRACTSPWQSTWDKCLSYELAPYQDGFKATTNKSACLEDLQDLTSTDFHPMWKRLSMPALLLRCNQPIANGFVVPAAERDLIQQAVPHLQVAELNCDHETVMTNEHAMKLIKEFIY